MFSLFETPSIGQTFGITSTLFLLTNFFISFSGVSIKGLISVTKVKVSGDLKYAKVYVSMLNAKDNKQVLAALKKSAGFVRTEVAKRINLRTTPEIIFIFDDSIEYGARIDTILKNVIKDIKPENKGE